jgi:hypothetical protein
VVEIDRRSPEKPRRVREIREMDPTPERIANALVESGDYRVIRRFDGRFADADRIDRALPPARDRLNRKRRG